MQPAGKLDQSRADYANSIDPSNGFLYSTRIIDYEGPEQACNATGNCATRNVALNAKRGYDNIPASVPRRPASCKHSRVAEPRRQIALGGARR